MSIFQSMLSLLANNVKPHSNSGKRMVSAPLMTYTTITAQSAESIVNHRVLSSIKLGQERIKRLCVASETDEKLSWKLINGQRSTS